MEVNSNKETQNYIYRNPHKFSLADSKKIKLNLNDYKDSFIPMIRVYNYSEMNINYIDQILTPPALFSLTIGKIYNDFSVDDQTNSFFNCKKVNLRLTSTASAFDENEIVDLLNQLTKLLTNPITISL